MALISHTSAQNWWDGMNRGTRRDLIKQFRFPKRDDYSFDRLSRYEQRIVTARYEHYRKVCERVDREHPPRG